MPRHATLMLAEIRAVLPRGIEAMWDAIRVLDAAGPWSVTDVASHAHCDRVEAGRYVRALVKCAYAQAAGERPTHGYPAPLFTLLRKPFLAPRFDRDGTPSRPSGQEQMWTAIRNLSSGFTFREIAHAASTDVVTVQPVAARSYLKCLLRAGYLATLKAGGPGRPAVLRLKPGMNTGPLPPLILRTKFVWDQNRKAVMGEADEAEEVRP